MSRKVQVLALMLHPMELYVFWMFNYQRRHHWKGIQILCTSFATLGWDKLPRQSIKTKFFFNFTITKRLTLLSLKLYLLHLFNATLCRLLLVVSKVCSSIALKWLFLSLSWMSWRLNVKRVWLDVTKGLNFCLDASSNKPRTGNMKQKLCFRYWTICYC